MRATFRYVLLTAIRDRFPLAILVTLLALTAVTFLIGVSTLSEGQQMAQAYAGELYRTAIVLGLVIFACFHVRGMYETREIEAILTRPISRHGFVLAYFAAFASLATALSILTVPLLVLVIGANALGLAEWEASMILESWIVCALAIFCAMALRSATAAVLVTLGLYFVGRSAEFFLAIARTRSGASTNESFNTLTEAIITVVSAIVPRLDLFGQSRWLVYGAGGAWGVGILLLQTAIYVPLILIATTRDLRTKTF